jgi:hypothetical protein
MQNNNINLSSTIKMRKRISEKLEVISKQAERLKQVRITLRLRRNHIEKKYNIPTATLKAWENALTGITEKGLKRCIDVYRQEGMLLTREWILEGTGLSPRVSLDMRKYLASDLRYSRCRTDGISAEGLIGGDVGNNMVDEATRILHEAAFFKESYHNSVVLAVTNDDMDPMYQIGDFVGGVFRYGKSISSVNKYDCIVRLVSGELLLRRLFRSSDGGYNLSCINPAPSSSGMPIIFGAEIECAAPVIWHRRHNPSERAAI